jgi:hypothetical protein
VTFALNLINEVQYASRRPIASDYIWATPATPCPTGVIVVETTTLFRVQGKRVDLLNPIYGWFTEGFDTQVLQEAKSLLDELM